MEQHPDRLIAFLDALHEYLIERGLETHPESEVMVALVGKATEANLTGGEFIAPDYEDGRDYTEVELYALQLHTHAFALTGASANSRKAVSQIGGADVLQRRHPGFVDELVARVADELAREKS